MKTNHSAFLIMAIVITVFVGAIYGYMYYMINDSVDNAVESQSLISSALLAKERESNFLDTYKATATKWSSLQGFFVDSKKVVNFIETVENISEQSGTKISISSIEADNLENAPLGKEGTIRLHISTSGPWSNVMRVLALAEALPFKVSVNNVAASVTSDVIETSKSKNTKTKIAVWNLSFDLKAAMIVSTTTGKIGIK